MKKMRISYTDGTTKELEIKNLNIIPAPQGEHNNSMCHINPHGEGISIHVTADLIPDLRFVKSFDFLGE